jgi:hypothetical protein
MLFIADQNSATIEGELYTFYELSVGATTYRIGTGNVPEPQATTYNYYRVDLYSLASEGSTHLLDVIMPDGYVGVAKQADEFTAWSYTDLAARVANGQVGVAVIKKFLRVRYTADGEAKTDTIENYEADPATEKVWIKAYIPHKWYGGRYEHFE